METAIIEELRRLVPGWVKLPVYLESSYDEEADVLYISFERGVSADDTELTNDDILLRYKDERLVGVTVLHASTRSG